MPYEVRDRIGRLHAFAEPPLRVISLVPSLTETLFELGAGESVAAVTDYCLYPEAALASLPRIGGTKNPRIEAIRELGPDLIYVNLEENLRRHADAIAEFAPVFATEPKSVADVVDLLENLGRIHQCEEAAAEWIDRIEAELAQLASRSRPFTFACAIWKDPWMWCGGDTYVSDLVVSAGGENVLATEERYPSKEIQEIASLKPELVFLPDEPYAFTSEDAEAVARWTGARVIGPFPGHLFTWHGTRTLLGLGFLRENL